MISYKQWKLLNESLGSFNLGIKNPHNLGLVSQHDVVSDDDKANFEEMGMMPKMSMPKMHMDDADGSRPFMKKKKPMPPMGGDMGMGGMGGMGDEDMPMGDEDMDDEEMPMDGEDMGDEDMDDEDMDDQSIDPDADMDDEDMDDEEMGDEDMGDEEDMDLDGEEMGDEEMGDEEDDGMTPPMPMKKKRPPMGEPHKVGPFMQFARKMKEGCGDKDMNVKGGDEEESDDVPEKGKEIAFLQKKNMKKKMSAGNTTAKETKLSKPSNGDGKAAPKGNPGVKKFQKKCSTGDDGAMKMCGKCKKQKKNMKESSGYERPAKIDNTEAGFFASIANMYGNPNERFSDGMREFDEDMLVPPTPEPVDTPGPGQIGYAPQTRIGDDNMGETVQNLIEKIAKLERQLKNK